MLDMILEVIGQVAANFVDWTARFFVVAVSGLSLGLGVLTAWLMLTSAGPSTRPWESAVFASSMLVGLPGLFLSLLHLIRDETDQGLATICVAVNVGAILLPAVWL
jgi:hypothetical protein